jgi:hypothetical protein
MKTFGNRNSLEKSYKLEASILRKKLSLCEIMNCRTYLFSFRHKFGVTEYSAKNSRIINEEFLKFLESKSGDIYVKIVHTIQKGRNAGKLSEHTIHFASMEVDDHKETFNLVVQANDEPLSHSRRGCIILINFIVAFTSQQSVAHANVLADSDIKRQILHFLD